MSIAQARRWAVLLVLVLHVAACAVLVTLAVRNPLGNWDMTPYAALALRTDGMSAEQVSQRAHDAVRAYIGDERFNRMVAGGQGEAAYQATMFRDAAAFAENLRFYDVKPVYVGLSRLVAPAIGNPAVATVAVSAAAFALALAVFPFFFRHRAVAVVGAWLLVTEGSLPLAIVATASSPDTLSLLFVVVSAMCAVTGRHLAWVLAAGLLAVLSRPDAAFILCPLLLGLAWIHRDDGRWKGWLGAMAVLFLAFVALGMLALPWSTLFHHTFFERLAYPVTGPVPPVNLARYLGVVSVTLPNALEPRVILFLLAGAGIAVVPWVKYRTIAHYQVLAAAAVAGIVLHFLAFPIDEFGHERMFLGSYFMTLAAALLMIDAWRLQPARDA